MEKDTVFGGMFRAIIKEGRRRKDKVTKKLNYITLSILLDFHHVVISSRERAYTFHITYCFCRLLAMYVVIFGSKHCFIGSSDCYK